MGSYRTKLQPGRSLSTLRLPALAALAAALICSFYLLLVIVAAAIVGAALYSASKGGMALPILVVSILLFRPLAHAIVAALPRGERRRFPGVAVSREEEPELWALVDAVCSRTGERLPDDLRITLTGNGYVTEFGHRLGRRPKRILSLPLAYFAGLTESQLAMVVGHEIAHLRARDATFTRWLGRVSAPMERTLDELERIHSILRWPFYWHAHAFHTLAAALSRRQELAADAQAAQLFSAMDVARMLLDLEPLSGMFAAYWDLDVLPLLDSGFRPPLAEGFALFREAALLEEHEPRQQYDDARDRFATHPPLSQRIAALELKGPGDPPVDASANRLLRSTDTLERSLLAATADDRALDCLETVSWSDAGERAYAQILEKPGEPLELPADATALDLRVLVGSESGSRDDGDLVAAPQTWRFAVALIRALRRRGWTLEKLPRRPFRLTLDGRDLQPFEEIGALAQDANIREGWPKRCEELGIADTALQRADGAAASNSEHSYDRTRLDAAVELALDDSAALGPLSHVVWIVVLLLGVPLTFAMLILPFQATTPVPAKIFGATVGAICLLTLGLIARLRRRAKHDPPRLRIDEDGLTVVHPQLLHEPLHLPAEMVRVMSVDDAGTCGPASLPVFEDSPWETPDVPADLPLGWLWTRGTSQLPYYSLASDPPNVAVLLEAVIPGPRVRRERLHGPLNGECVSALLLRVAEPELARAHLKAVGHVRALSARDTVRPEKATANTASAA